MLRSLATFRPDDPTPLVLASLACPMCLSATSWTLSDDPLDPVASCSCEACGEHHEVALTQQQGLRLAFVLAPADRR